MNRKQLFLPLLALTLILSACAPQAQPSPVPPSATPAPARRVIGYYASWATERGFTASKIHADKLTHINYAFANVSEDGKCIVGDPAADVERAYSAEESVSGVADSEAEGALRGNFNQLIQLKAKYPHLQTLISVGGWTWSANFSAAAESDEKRKTFVTSCIDIFLKQYKGVFDGIDIDWEYPVNGGLQAGKPEDKQNYTLLLAEFRKQLDELGQVDNKHYLLTIAAPAGSGVALNLERNKIIQSLDWINLMTYDIHGIWEKTTNFNAPLYSPVGDPGGASATVDGAIQGYLKAGVPANQLVMGVPFYGHGWLGVGRASNGLYQPAFAGAPGKYELGAFDYKELKDDYFATYARSWQAEAQVPWLYNINNGIFISYDDPESIAAKAGYVKDHDLGGIMIWELSQDDDGELLAAVHKGFEVGGLPHIIPTPDPAVLSIPRPFTQDIHAVSDIKIDADLTDWPAEPTFNLNDKSQIVFTATPNLWTGPEDLSTQAWVGWSADGLYMAFNVTDDKLVQNTADANIWHGDYMELQVDTELMADYGDPGMSGDDYQIGISVGDFAGRAPATIFWFGPTTTPLLKTIQRAQIKTETGYILEMFFPKDIFPGIQFSEGSVFGLNINPSDSDGADQEVMLSTSAKRMLSNPLTLGKIVLVK